MKQVIVMRTDLNMRKGKMIAQGVHASLGALQKMQMNPAYSLLFARWQEDYERVITVRVNSEAELDSIYELAKKAELPVSMVIDLGFTEFHGLETKTCLCIGPSVDEWIDQITGALPLL